MKAYAPYHHLYAISQFFAIHNNQPERVPKPSTSYNNAEKFGAVDEIVTVAAESINVALETAAAEDQPSNRVFSPQNWTKSKTCLSAIDAAVRMNLRMSLKRSSDSLNINKALTLTKNDFEYRWEGTD